MNSNAIDSNLAGKPFACGATGLRLTPNLDETLDAVNTQSAYTSWAPNYDTDVNLTRDLDREVSARMLGDKRYALTVEAACGTGKNTPFFASVSDSVLALDFSLGMLSVARQRVRETNVKFQQNDLLETWPCADEAAALVSCNLVLEHIENLQHIFNEAARVLAVGGTFFVSELHPHKQYLGSQARFVDAQHIETRIEAFVHHLSDYLHAAEAANLTLEKIEESWHPKEMGQNKPPRLISFIFRKLQRQDER